MMTVSFFIIRQGLQDGLERYSKYMMLAFIVILLGLAVWATTLDGAAVGYRWYLMPDFSKINLQVVLSALGQLFFSIGVGMAIAFAFGSYTNNKENLITSTGWIVFIDTLFAVLAGLIIFPAIFSFGLSPDSGPNLIFITMVSIFGRLEYGQLLGSIFFLLLFLAGFTSLLSNLQGLKDSFQDKYNLSSFNALLFVSGFITIGSIPVVFSYSDNSVQLFGMTVFGLLDYLTNKIMLPLNGLLIAIFGAYVIGYEKLKAHLELGAENIKIGNYWKYIIKWIIPISLLIILFNGII
jgi:NSS family neurotransmitter:Na+ symporter